MASRKYEDMGTVSELRDLLACRFGWFTLFALLLLPWLLAKYWLGIDLCGYSENSVYLQPSKYLLVIGACFVTSLALQLRLEKFRLALLKNLPGFLLCLAIVAESPFNLLYGASTFLPALFLHDPRPILRADLAPYRPFLRLAGSIYLACMACLLITCCMQTTGPRDCARILPIKANMFTFQTIVETYALDHGGKYPENVSVLYQEASRIERGYWKAFNNPLAEGRQPSDYLTGYGKSYLDLSSYLRSEAQNHIPRANQRSLLGFRLKLDVNDPPGPYRNGVVLYARPTPSLYFIYGTTKDGALLQRYKGSAFFLTNS